MLHSSFEIGLLSATLAVSPTFITEFTQYVNHTKVLLIKLAFLGIASGLSIVEYLLLRATISNAEREGSTLFDYGRISGYQMPYFYSVS